MGSTRRPASDRSAETAPLMVWKMGKIHLSATVNGQACGIAVEPGTTLLEALRDGLGLTGTKKGCDRGECGACTDDPAKAIAVHAQDPQLAFIAGGTDLLGLIKDRAALPERLLDINHLPDMARIEALHNGDLWIGALARMSDLAAHPEVRARFPVVAEALLFAASGQLRNMASIG